MRRYRVLLSLLLGLRPRACYPSACVRLGDLSGVVGVLDRQPTKGRPKVVDCAVRIVIGRPRTQRYALGHGTQDLYRFGLPRWRALHPVWGIKYGALRLVLVEIRCPARYPALLYIVQGRVPSRLQGRSPSRITRNES
jgi:hypothetical protein